ncbi:hypothetical protein D3C73_1257040 [compost metagenome]
MPTATASRMTPVRRSRAAVAGGLAFSLLMLSITSGGRGWPFSMAARRVACISRRSRLFSQAGMATMATTMRKGARGMRISKPFMGCRP